MGTDTQWCFHLLMAGGDKGWSHQAVWADADKYMEEMEAEQELTELEKQLKKQSKGAEAAPEGDQALVQATA
jgi:hypothetical protein